MADTATAQMSCVLGPSAGAGPRIEVAPSNDVSVIEIAASVAKVFSSLADGNFSS
jgi:hypothetical protein